MTSLLNILDAGISILVPALVWTLLAVGVYQLARESIQEAGAHRRVARGTRS